MIKGLINKKGLIKMLFYMLILFLIYFCIAIYQNNVTNKIDAYINKEEFRTLTVYHYLEQDVVDLYTDRIESIHRDSNTSIIVFKTVNDLNYFLDNSGEKDTFNIVPGQIPGEFSKICTTVLIYILYVLSFILVIIFSLNYYRQTIKNWKLFIILGYSKRMLSFISFLILFVLYSIVYTVLLILSKFLFSLDYNFMLLFLIALAIYIALRICASLVKLKG